MEEDRASRQREVQKDMADAPALPSGTTRFAPTAPPLPVAPSGLPSFAGVQLRPDGERYGDADLVPGGSLVGSGGMLMTERNFRGPEMPADELHGSTSRRPDVGSADGYARFDPIFPGQRPPAPLGGFGGGERGRRPPVPRMPGEPDNDLFLPPQGGPGEPFGGPGRGQFGPGYGQFGSRQGGGGWGGAFSWS